jgi:hypothetical protein
MNFGFSASYVALWALVGFQGLLVLVVLRQLAELRQLVDQGTLPTEDWLPVGSQAPEFAGQDIHSGDFVSRSPSENSSQVLLNSLETKRSVCKFVSHGQDLQNLPS